ncbi:hypothetical protein K7W42_15535 [Deinococcus sp. HMF7604]|uniref:tetratricopeptide repeat protein n=1 Tax=Deinococcus betulae TaxID=2873312 RepID=UPI001CC8F588|nr:hypothetical protein [Deinococcus betulae]MBZ9752265.1 hypothetical protein [Deinococcus betulae]
MIEELAALREQMELSTGHVRLNLLLELAFLYRDVDAQLGVYLCREAAALADQYNDAPSQALALITEAMNLERLGHNLHALDRLSEAQIIVERSKDAYVLARLWHARGIIDVTRGQFYEALRSFLRCEGVSAVSDNLWLLSSVLSNIALIYDQLGEHAAAASYHQRSLKLSLATGRSDVQFYAVNNIGVNCMCLGLWKEALAYHKEAYAVANSQGRLYGVMLSALNLAETYTALGEIDAAQIASEEAIHQARHLQDKKILAGSLAIYAQIQYNLQNFEATILALREALRLVSELGGFHKSSSYHLLLADALLRLGEDDRACFHLHAILDVGLALPTEDHLLACQRLVHLFEAKGEIDTARAYEVKRQEAETAFQTLQDHHQRKLTQIESFGFEFAGTRQASSQGDSAHNTTLAVVQQELQDGFDRARRRFEPFAVVVLAVDHSERVPLEALSAVQTTLKQLLATAYDTVTLLPAANALTFLMLSTLPSREVAPQVRKFVKRVQALRWPSSPALRVTASAGCCTTLAWSQAEDMLRVSSRLLSQAQGLGGNQVCATPLEGRQ